MNSDKKIVFISSEGLPFGYSASANKIRLIGKIFNDNQFDVYCLNKMNGSNNRKFGFYNGIKFAYFNPYSKSRNLFYFLFYYVLSYIKEFYFLLKTTINYNKKYIILQYDWFPVFLYYCLISKIFNLKVIINIMEWHLALPCNNNLKKINNFLFDKFSFKFASAAIPISKFIRDKIFEINPSLPTFILPAISDFDEIINIKINNNEIGKYVLYCGNLGYFEVISFILKSFSFIRNEDVKLLLIVNGTASDFNKLNKLVKKMNLEFCVLIEKNLSFLNLISRYKNASGLLIPLRNTDQDRARFPHKISEYTATKRPIVTTNFGVIVDYFNSENAYISLDYSPLNFSKKIDFLLDNPQDANKIGINGFKLGLDKLNSKTYNYPLINFMNKI